MARKKKVVYRPSRPKKGPAPAPTAPIVPPSLVSIDTSAGLGREGIVAGSRVRILGGGLYAGELATVERLVGGVIPAALVRTEAGRTRQVRTIDLEPVARAVPAPVADAAPLAEPAADAEPTPAADAEPTPVGDAEPTPAAD